jgi:hypothetical protein
VSYQCAWGDLGRDDHHHLRDGNENGDDDEDGGGVGDDGVDLFHTFPVGTRLRLQLPRVEHPLRLRCSGRWNVAVVVHPTQMEGCHHHHRIDLRHRPRVGGEKNPKT